MRQSTKIYIKKIVLGGIMYFKVLGGTCILNPVSKQNVLYNNFYKNKFSQQKRIYSSEASLVFDSTLIFIPISTSSVYKNTGLI